MNVIDPNPLIAAIASVRPDEVTLHVVRLAELALHRERLVASLSPAENVHAARFRHPHDRDAWLLRRGFLRERLAISLDRCPRSLPLERGPWGKPFLAGTCELHFNASSSGPYVAVALCRCRPVGLDIERVRVFPRMDEFAACHFTDAGRTALAVASPTEFPAVFWRIWTRVEALAKWDGRGLGASALGDSPPNACDVVVRHESIDASDPSSPSDLAA